MTNPVMVRVITYSQPSPGRKMKKPLPRWLVTMATSITPITAAPPSGVSRPRTSIAPPTTSVMLASQACTMPGFMPRLANQRPVPAILPPPKMWLIPCASITAPTPQRSASRARLIESRSALSIAGQRTGIDRFDGPSVASTAMPKASTVAKLVGLATVAAAGVLAVKEAKKRSDADAASGHPISSSSRNARSVAMAGIGAKAGGQYALHRARKVFASAERHAELDAAYELQTAEAIAETLGNMKGAMMKLGRWPATSTRACPSRCGRRWPSSRRTPRR
jgi:hypothetical protein